jgi:1-aminocyclopropane-1-carboxylate deaminase
MYLPITNISFDKLNTVYLSEKGVSVTVARLDKIHEQVSGNKLFKLHYFIEDCLTTTHKTMLTFGGAFSNHLVATAFLCKEKGINCIAVVRGEEPKALSHTLEQCKKLGMQLHFISRNDYKDIEQDFHIQKLKNHFGNFTIVPEGGYAKAGAKGAALILDLLNDKHFTHICTCVGTATTLAGILLNAKRTQKVIAIPVIKNMTDIEERVKNLTGIDFGEKLIQFTNYDFGGYAKYNSDLIAFMNRFYEQYNIPTDFVYTAKMMYAIMDKIEMGYFEKGSNIMCLHTGGLQGNYSLPNNTLIF